MENSVYFNNITAARSLLLSEEEQFEGCTTISLETCEDLTEADIYTYITENFPEFLRKLRYLKREDQELLLSYYLLGKTQTTLAVIHKSTQTVCSSRIRMAIRVLGGAFLNMGEPSVETLHRVFEKVGIEDSLITTPLSEIVTQYASCRNFQQISEVYNLHRPDVRRAMSSASKLLMHSKDPDEAAIAAWIYSLVDKSNPTGHGYSKRKAAKQGHLYRTDEDITGKFVVDVEDPEFEKALFVSRANR